MITYNVHVKLKFHNFFSILVHSTLILYFLPWQIKNFLTTLFKQWLTLLSTMYPNKMQPMILHSYMVTKVKVFRKLHVFIDGFFFVCHQCSRHFQNSIYASSKGHNGLQIRYTLFPGLFFFLHIYHVIILNYKVGVNTKVTCCWIACKSEYMYYSNKHSGYSKCVIRYTIYCI